jgi:ABC-type Fe3+ transport system permease subunit
MVLLWASLLPYLQLPSAEAFAQLSLNNYETIFDFVDALPFINTAILMLAVPTGTMLLAVLVSWIVVRTQISFRGALDTVAFCPLRYQASCLRWGWVTSAWLIEISFRFTAPSRSSPSPT